MAFDNVGDERDYYEIEMLAEKKRADLTNRTKSKFQANRSCKRRWGANHHLAGRKILIHPILHQVGHPGIVFAEHEMIDAGHDIELCVFAGMGE